VELIGRRSPFAKCLLKPKLKIGLKGPGISRERSHPEREFKGNVLLGALFDWSSDHGAGRGFLISFFIRERRDVP